MPRETALLSVRALALAAVMVSAGARSAAAQPGAAAPARDPIAAEALFGQAKELVAAGRHAEACPKFAESHRLDAGIGVLLYLGDCYVEIGKLATAWATLREAADAAQAAGQVDREAIARKKIAALEPRLPRLTIAVPESHRVMGLEVRRDEILLGAPLFGNAVFVDPGPHVIEASAPGRVPFRTTIESAEADAQVVEIPALAMAASASAGPPDPAADGAWTGQHTAGVVVGAVGAASLVVGAVTGVVALSTWSDAEAHCEGDGEPLACDADGVDQGEQASTFATVSTISFVAGGVLLAGGAALFFTAPSARSEAARARSRAAFTPWVGPSIAGGVLAGEF